MQCRAHVSQLGKLYDQFKASGAEVIVILGNSLERAQQYAKLLSLPFPVLADPERRVYQQYELEKQFFLQRTASIVVDRNSIVRYSKRTTLPNVWLQESRELLGFVDNMDDKDKQV